MGAHLIFSYPQTTRPGELDQTLLGILPTIQGAKIPYSAVPLDSQLPHEVLRRQLHRIVEKTSGRIILGGFSLGGLLSVEVAATLPVQALVCLGFPFHARGAPLERRGLNALREVSVPTLVIQGTRDPYGSYGEVRGYLPLPLGVAIQWLKDGNHRFLPRKRSKITIDTHLASAGEATLRFIHGQA